MPTAPSAPIRTYQPETFLRRFAADPTPLERLLTAAAEQFFVVAVEQMYPLFAEAIPPVRATAHTCLLLTSGTARMRIGDDAHVIGAGEALIVRAGQLYSFAPGDVNTGLLCHFHPDFLLAGGGSAEALAGFGFLQFWGPARLRLGAAAGFAEGLLRRLLADYQLHQLRHPELLRAYLWALLHELAQADAPAAPARPTAAQRLTLRFQQLLATELRHTQRVAGFAARLHVTPGHLGKAVRSVTGTSAARWIEQTQVREARTLLYQSSLTVGEIALEVGVADASYFSRLFRKHTGLTPLAFRQRLGSS